MSDQAKVQNAIEAKIEPGSLILVRGEWWRVVKIKSPEDDHYKRTIIRVTTLGGHSTDYWEPHHVEDVKPYDGLTLDWKKQ